MHWLAYLIQDRIDGVTELFFIEFNYGHFIGKTMKLLARVDTIINGTAGVR